VKKILFFCKDTSIKEIYIAHIINNKYLIILILFYHQYIIIMKLLNNISYCLKFFVPFQISKGVKQKLRVYENPEIEYSSLEERETILN
jgi:hypothetical protein